MINVKYFISKTSIDLIRLASFKVIVIDLVNQNMIPIIANYPSLLFDKYSWKRSYSNISAHLARNLGIP